MVNKNFPWDWGWGLGDWEQLFRVRVSVGDGEEVLGTESGDGHRMV